MRFEVLDWVHLDQENFHPWAFVNTIINLFHKGEEFIDQLSKPSAF